MQEPSQKQAICEGELVPGTTAASTEVLAMSMRAAKAAKISGRKFLEESIVLVDLLSGRDKDQKRGREVEIFICFPPLKNNKQSLPRFFN